MSGLANNIGYRILKRKRKSLGRITQVHNFKTAKTAAIIFDASIPDCFPVIKEFRKFLVSEKIKCHAIGIVSEKEVPSQMLFWDKYDFITKKDMNWLKKPKGEVAETFLEATPNILFDFTFNAPVEIQYLVQLSKADFKIGCYTEDENDYDFMINPTGECSLQYFVDQIKHYVNMLNPS